MGFPLLDVKEVSSEPRKILVKQKRFIADGSEGEIVHPSYLIVTILYALPTRNHLKME